jgi:hypothetical protein
MDYRPDTQLGHRRGEEISMKHTFLTAAFVLASAPAFAAGPVVGEYVEARTAEVFAGGCIMSSQAETMGREAVLAWHVTSGAYDGEELGGLSVVAAVSGDRNLGIREIGGEAPSSVRGVVFVDQQATPAQQRALVRLAQTMSRGLITDLVDVKPVAVDYTSTPMNIAVTAGDAKLAVQRHNHHTAGCGAMKWFTPFSAIDDATIGVADQHQYEGRALGIRWSDPNRKSAFSGTFSLSPSAGTN